MDYSDHFRSKARHPCDQKYGKCVAQLTVTQCFSDLLCMGRLNAQHSQPYYNAHTFTMHGQINYPAHLLHPFPGASAKRSWQWPADTKTFHAPLVFACSSSKQRAGMGSWDGFIVLFQCCTGVFLPFPLYKTLFQYSQTVRNHIFLKHHVYVINNAYRWIFIPSNSVRLE